MKRLLIVAVLSLAIILGALLLFRERSRAGTDGIGPDAVARDQSALHPILLDEINSGRRSPSQSPAMVNDQRPSLDFLVVDEQRAPVMGALLEVSTTDPSFARRTRRPMPWVQRRSTSRRRGRSWWM